MDHLQTVLPPSLLKPTVAIVCGSGLSGLADILTDTVYVDYSTLPGFATASVPGHKSFLAFGLLGKQKIPVVAQLGRFHAYEGHPLTSVVHPIRFFKHLGVKAVILTNAAGGLNPQNNVGTVVAVLDHLGLPSLTSWNPLIGKNDDTLGPRFPPMSDAYDYPLRVSAFKAAKELGWTKGQLTEGVYAWVAGPTYETKAEQRFLKAAGADVVGMSTVPEVIAARHCGLRILVLSLITNLVLSSPYKLAEDEVYGDGSPSKEVVEEEVAASHEEVLDASNARADDVRGLVERIVELEFGKERA
ncbi:hypothetical protein T439DRAFT_328641 [Meredithblackwellia eburnea MCA 4105]